MAPGRQANDAMEVSVQSSARRHHVLKFRITKQIYDVTDKTWQFHYIQVVARGRLRCFMVMRSRAPSRPGPGLNGMNSAPIRVGVRVGALFIRGA